MHQFEEWDLQAWQRKFLNSFAVFDLRGKPETFFVSGISWTTTHPVFAIEINHTMKGPHAKVETTAKKPFYHHIKAGWYRDYMLEKVLLIRKLGKQFSVGVTSENAQSHVPSDKDILKPTNAQRYPELMEPYRDPFEKVLEESGVASKNFFFGKHNVYHLDNHVGFRDRHTFMIEPKYETEIRDIFMDSKLEPVFQ